ncbi:MAG: hypothetical protein M0R21_05460 [Lentimicrobiaceae bacterium]|nr:hypothetical protein [Lentimicrobiaceae bacterium]
MVSNVLVDGTALALVIFVPAISHLSGMPVYYIEPMRLMLILAIIHTSKNNAFFIASILPLFSFLFSGHPIPLKMMVITAELVINTALFYFFINKKIKVFYSVFSSIFISKIFCYLLYIPLFSIAFALSELNLSFVVAQVISTLLFSLYALFVFKRK